MRQTRPRSLPYTSTPFPLVNQSVVRAAALTIQCGPPPRRCIVTSNRNSLPFSSLDCNSSLYVLPLSACWRNSQSIRAQLLDWGLKRGGHICDIVAILMYSAPVKQALGLNCPPCRQILINCALNLPPAVSQPDREMDLSPSCAGCARAKRRRRRTHPQSTLGRYKYTQGQRQNEGVHQG